MKPAVADALISHGFDSRSKAFISWLGTIYYLSRETIEETFASLAKVSAPGSRMVFDYFLPKSTMSAVLKAKSIWVATFLHGVVNSVYGFMLRYVVHPDDKVVSFGLGIYGLACLAVVVLFILRDPIWVTGSSEK